MNINKELQEIAAKLSGSKHNTAYSISLRNFHGVGSYDILGLSIYGTSREIKFEPTETFDDNLKELLKEFKDFYEKGSRV